MLIQANAATIPLADGSVDVVPTSPPFWRLREYAGEQGVSWPNVMYVPMSGLDPITVPAMQCALGWEPTPAAYVGHLVLIWREIWRVLRPTGVSFINLGDSRINNPGNGRGGESVSGGKPHRSSGDKTKAGLPEKNLALIPYRAVLALQADGWIVRSDLIWNKPNVLPNSAQDRPVTSHEYVFLLSKSERYYFNHAAVREKAASSSLKRIRQKTFAQQIGGPKDYGKTGVNPNRSMRRTLENFARNPGRNIRTVWTIPTEPNPAPHYAGWPSALVEKMLKATLPTRGVVMDPFVGSGVTGSVVHALGGQFVGLDLGFTYLRDIAAPRLSTAFGGAAPRPNGHSTESWADLPLFQEPAP